MRRHSRVPWLVIICSWFYHGYLEWVAIVERVTFGRRDASSEMPCTPLCAMRGRDTASETARVGHTAAKGDAIAIPWKMIWL